MVGMMRDDINMIISAMIHTQNEVDFSRIMTQENMFDASVIRSFQPSKRMSSKKIC